MPPVRSTPMIKPVKTERSHEENQERAYIAASRRSDRSLEARIESARRASEIHKRRTGRSLRVREEDVLNEEMYEEEDDDVPSQMRRLNALQGLTGPFGNRLQSSLAMQLGMRDALSQALLRNQQYQNATANANSNGDASFMNPMMQQSAMTGGMMSQHNMQMPYMGPQSWQLSQNIQNMPHQAHARSVSIATPQDPAFQQQLQSAYAQNGAFNLHLDSRRMSMPAQSNNAQTSRSPVGSNPGTPHGLVSVAQSPQQVPTPPHSASPYTPGQNSAAADSPQEQRAALPKQQRPASNQSNPLTLQLPQETQQMLGLAGPGFNDAFFSQPPLKTPSGNAYSYNPNGPRKNQPQSPHDFKRNNPMILSQPASLHTGLNQTISPSALYSFSDANNFATSATSTTFSDLPSSAISATPDLNFNSFINFNDEYNSFALASGMPNMSDDMHSGWASPNATNSAEPSWNPEDFVNFGPPT